MAQSDGNSPEEPDKNNEDGVDEEPSRYRVAAGSSFPLTSVRWVAPYGAREGVGVFWIALGLFILALAVLTVENAGTAALILGGILLLALMTGRRHRHRHYRRHHRRRRHHRHYHYHYGCERWSRPEREETPA